MPDGYYVENGYFTWSILTDDTTWNIYPSQRYIDIYTYGIDRNSEQIQVSGAKFELTFFSGNTLYENTSCGYMAEELKLRETVEKSGNSIKITVGKYTGIYKLSAGNYKLTELASPENYDKIQPICFALDEYGQINGLENANLRGKNAIKIIYSKVISTFKNVEKLRKIVIPESVKQIGTRSFSGTDLKSVKIASDCEYSESSFPEGSSK